MSMLFKRIKDWATTATEDDLLSENYFALDGVGGTKKGSVMLPVNYAMGRKAKIVSGRVNAGGITFVSDNTRFLIKKLPVFNGMFIPEVAGYDYYVYGLNATGSTLENKFGWVQKVSYADIIASDPDIALMNIVVRKHDAQSSDISSLLSTFADSFKFFLKSEVALDEKILELNEKIGDLDNSVFGFEFTASLPTDTKQTHTSITFKSAGDYAVEIDDTSGTISEYSKQVIFTKSESVVSAERIRTLTFTNENPKTLTLTAEEAALVKFVYLNDTAVDAPHDFSIKITSSDSIAQKIEYLEAKIQGVASGVELEVGAYKNNGVAKRDTNSRIRNKEPISYFDGMSIPQVLNFDIEIWFLDEDNSLLLSTGWIKTMLPNTAPVGTKTINLMIGRSGSGADISGSLSTIQENFFIYDNVSTHLQDQITRISPPVVLPSYYDTYLAGKIEDVNDVNETFVNGISFVFITDSHWQANAGYSGALARKIVENTSACLVIHGGDFAPAYGSEDDLDVSIQRTREFVDVVGKENIFICRGNHDFTIKYNRDSDDGVTKPVSVAYDVLTRNSEWHANVPSGELYFSIDNASQKTRIICLNTSETQHAGGWGIQLSITQTQLDWLTAQILEHNDWNIIVVSHVCLNHEAEFYEMFEPVVDILSAAQAHSGDFLGWEGKIICSLSGHSHIDLTKFYGGVRYIATTSDAYYSDGGWDRTQGTTNEQAFDVVSIDFINSQVHLTRIGAGNDRNYSLVES